MFAEIDRAELVDNRRGGLTLERSHDLAQFGGWRVAQQKMDVIGLTRKFLDFTVVLGGHLRDNDLDKILPLKR